MASSLDELSTCEQTVHDVTSRTTSKKDATSVGQPLSAVVPSETLIRRVSKDTPVQVWGAEAQARTPLSWSAAVRRRVERFGRRGTEPFERFERFEPFEFFQNRNFSLENSTISENFNIF